MAKSKKGRKKNEPRSTPSSTKKSQSNKNIAKIECEGGITIVISGIKEDFQTTKAYIAKAMEVIKNPELIVVGEGDTKKIEALQRQFSEAIDLKILASEEISAGVAAATSDYVLIVDELTIPPQNLADWLNENGTIPDSEIWAASRLDKDSKLGKKSGVSMTERLLNSFSRLFVGFASKDIKAGFRFMPTKMAKLLFGNISKTKENYSVELLHLARMYDFKVVDKPITTSRPSKTLTAKEIFSLSIGARIKSWSTWIKHFFIHPIRDTKADYFIKKESPWYRFSFAVIALLIFVVMPFLSLDYGMNADEHVQYEYGEKLLDYYETDGKNFEALFYKDLYNYGGLFEYFSAWCHHNLGWFDDPYDMRHFLNSLFGAVMMLFIGLIGRIATGSWKGALLAILFAVLSPRLFGHSMNNSKDIPFAMAFVFTIYHAIRLTQQLPKPTLRTCLAIILGIAAAINIRAGGILLIAYVGVFAGITFLWKPVLRKQLFNIRIVLKMLAIGFTIAVAGLWLGTAFWPYGALDWFNNPFIVLGKMSDYYAGIRVLFDSNHYWSDNLPWNYLPTWILYTTPLFVILGFFVSPIVAFIRRKQGKSLIVALLLFACLFPICYIIYQKSGVYDGMRHVLFAYALFPVLAAFTWYSLIKLFKQKAIKIGIASFMVILMILPATFMIKNHPFQYTYFNELIGGNNGAFAKYESDYWMSGVKPACEWYLDNIIENQKPGETITLATNCINPVAHYLGDKDVKFIYVSYNEREKYAWDYGLFYSRYVSRELLVNGYWPSDDVVHYEKVDDVPITVVIKRRSNPENIAGEAYKKGNWEIAAAGYEEIVKENPKNESAQLLLAQTYSKMYNWPKMKVALDNLLAISEEEANSWGLLGTYYLAVNDLDSARDAFERSIEIDYKYSYSIYCLAMMLSNENKYSEAMEYLYDYDEYGGFPAFGYDLAIQIATKTGNDVDKFYFTAKKEFINSNWPGALNSLSKCLSMNPSHEPALILKRNYDEVTDQKKLRSKLIQATEDY